MAKALSALVTVIRGSIGGVTFSSNQFAAIIARAKTSPVNPKTVAQALIRSGLSAGSQEWDNLDDAERQAWEDYAATLTFTGPLGSYTVPGRQVMAGNVAAFLRGNALLAVPEAPIYTAPTIPGFANFSDVKPNSPTATTGIAVNIGNPMNEDAYALVQRSVAFNPSRTRFKGPFLSSTSAFVLCADQTNTIFQYDDLAEGYVYFVRVRGITFTSGHRMTSEYIVRCVAETVAP